jgi:single-strand DNA-binding protein
MNTIQLIGRLTADPELRSLANDKSVATMRLAVARRDREAAPVYVDVAAFDQLAELCAEHLEKGRQVAISGRLEYSEWEAQDGSKRSKHEVIAGDVEFLAKAKRPAEESTPDEQGDS